MWKLDDFMKKFEAVKVPNGFNYTSGTNEEFLSVEQLRKLIDEHVDA